MGGRVGRMGRGRGVCGVCGGWGGGEGGMMGDWVGRPVREGGPARGIVRIGWIVRLGWRSPIVRPGPSREVGPARGIVRPGPYLGIVRPFPRGRIRGPVPNENPKWPSRTFAGVLRPFAPLATPLYLHASPRTFWLYEAKSGAIKGVSGGTYARKGPGRPSCTRARSSFGPRWAPFRAPDLMGEEKA